MFPTITRLYVSVTTTHPLFPLFEYNRFSLRSVNSPRRRKGWGSQERGFAGLWAEAAAGRCEVLTFLGSASSIRKRGRDAQ